MIKSRFIRKVLCIIIILASLVYIYAMVISSNKVSAVTRSTNDLLAFWAGAKILVEGGNPYDIELRQKTALDAISKKYEPSPVQNRTCPIYNPPWFFSIVFWFGYINIKIFPWIWISLSIIGIVFATLRVYHVLTEKLGNFRKVEKRRMFFWSAVLFASFHPIARTLSLGQLSWILLVCLAVTFPLLIRPRTAATAFTTGLVLSIPLIKPHLVFLLYVAIGIKELKGRRLWMLFGGAVGFATMVVFPIYFFPEIYQAYANSPFLDPFEWKTPTISVYITQMFESHNGFPRISLAAIGIIIVGIWAWREKEDILSPSMFIWSLMLSLICTPYLWSYDLVLMLPFILWILMIDTIAPPQKLGRNLVPLLLLSCNLLLFITQQPVCLHAWYPITVALIGLSQIKSYKYLQRGHRK